LEEIRHGRVPNSYQSDDPTTTRTGRFAYPRTNYGASPVSSNTAARIPCKTRIAALSQDNFLLAIIGEGAFRNKGKTSPALRWP
jgi:hypothetical protein